MRSITENDKITISPKLKKELGEFKGDKDWNEFLSELFGVYKETKKEKQVFRELSEEFNENELDEIKKSSKEFRKNFDLSTKKESTKYAGGWLETDKTIEELKELAEREAEKDANRNR